MSKAAEILTVLEKAKPDLKGIAKKILKSYNPKKDGPSDFYIMVKNAVSDYNVDFDDLYDELERIGIPGGIGVHVRRLFK